MTEAIDHVARASAQEANLKISAHEDRCGERWEQARAAHGDMKKSVEDLKKALVSGFRWMIGLVLGGMGGIIVMLVDKHK